MNRLRFLFACALLAAAHPATDLRASTVDDAGPRVVVPYVAWDDATDTTVYVTNHETRDVKVGIVYIGERTSPHPGRRSCGSVMITAGSLSKVDVLGQCGLSRPTGSGMVLLVESDAGIARLSARARIGLVSPMSGDLLQVLGVQGLPLATLDDTSNVHTVYGLRQLSTRPPMTTDCFFGTFADASGAGGVLGKLALVDAKGNDLGSHLFTVRPFELVATSDVFGMMGVTGDVEGARVEFRLAGGGDAVLGYCLTSEEGVRKDDRTVALELAQVTEPVDETRRREVAAFGGPAVGGFVLLATASRNLHGIYVRHLDRVTCNVASSVPNAGLVLTAFSPDGLQTIGGTSSSTGEFGGPGHAAVSGGENDVWGLQVTFGGAPPAGYLHVDYRISCMSGNGTSLADRVL